MLPGNFVAYCILPEGTVKFFNRAKGFGFIVPDDGGKEIFLPPAALGEGSSIKLSPGQRVSFETVDDPKGPKAAALKVLGEAPVRPPQPQSQPPVPRPPSQPHAQPPRASAMVSVICDPATPAAQDVLAALEALGQQFQLLDVSVTPPTAVQLKKWSQQLAGQGQELVRRNAALFFDLQLDDRFIHEDEFWTAVVQHPALLSGPILVGRDRVRVCRTAADVKAFFAAGETSVQDKPKEISSRLLAMMRGEAVGPRPVPALVVVEEEDEDDEEEDDSDEEDGDGEEGEADDEDGDAEEEDDSEEPATQPARADARAKAARVKGVKAAPAAKKPAAKKAATKPAAKKAVKKAR
jgi:CspA family cold shock protein